MNVLLGVSFTAEYNFGLNVLFTMWYFSAVQCAECMLRLPVLGLCVDCLSPKLCCRASITTQTCSRQGA